MWTDNVTDQDFLGFDVHANLIKELIKDEKMLPITIGLFGDWGSGKSSILEVLKKEIEKEPETACIYFNGWVFEGYDDAKRGNEKLVFPEELKEWNKPKIVNWIISEPLLSKVDLRDYYWISRDKLSSMQSNLLIPPIIKSLMTKLEPDSMAEKLTIKIFNDELKVLSEHHQSAFFGLLKLRIITEPEKNRHYQLFNIALREGFDCKSVYVEALTSVGKKLPPAAIESLKQLRSAHPEFDQFIHNKQKRKV